MSYVGPERRQHRVLVTNNSEYHLRGEVCVAVKSGNGNWYDRHEAVGSVMEGCIQISPQGGYLAKVGPDPEPGCRVCFSGDLLTSPLVEVARPPKEAVEHYAG